MILGFETAVIASITEWDPPHTAAGSISGRPLKRAAIRETYEVRSGGRTRVVRTIDLELPAVLKVLWPLLKPFVVRRWRAATNNMKTILEATPRTPLPGDDEAAPPGSLLSIRRTVMFTDIVASTPLMEAIGDTAWRDLRRWHDATLRAGFTRHRGRELDHAGDGFCVAFGSAADAVACAVDIERTLVEHRRTEGFAPQVRIGLHTADVQPDGDAITGAAMHVASRVAASAGAGEILATTATITESGIMPASPPRSISLRWRLRPPVCSCDSMVGR